LAENSPGVYHSTGGLSTSGSDVNPFYDKYEIDDDAEILGEVRNL